MTRERRVVVTGLGAVTPLASGVDSFWAALLAGRVATRPITSFSTEGYSCCLGAEVVDWALTVSELQSRSVQFASEAVRQAVEQAQLLCSDYPRDRIGVAFGVVVGNRPGLESGRLDAGAWCSPSAIAATPAAEHGFGGPNLVFGTACAAGNTAISTAADLVAEGKADAMVAGGADELSEAMFMMFHSFGALAPERVAPFDRDRQGLLLGEGAAALVVEERDAALRRGAPILGEVLGHASYSDAYHMTSPHPQGMGAVRSMAAAVQRAEVRLEDIDYISAHGTGTPANDPIEAGAIRSVFGENAKDLPVSSIKGMLGHTQGAASAIEAVVCLLAINHSIVPANVNCKNVDPACELDLVLDHPREMPVRLALNNAFGFGGNICCVVFGAP